MTGGPGSKGLMASGQDGAEATVGEDKLRAARRERVFNAMEGAGLDVLVLGRRDSVAYATGARSLWTAGTRPFGPACVLVAAGRTTHLLSTWDEGVPSELPFEHLYGITWNPATMAASLAGIPSLTEARRIGVDALSPGFARMAARLAPGAELVPADDLLHAVRTVKLPGEIDHIRAATALAKAGVEAASKTLTAGKMPVQARAAAIEALAARGVTIPSSGVNVARLSADAVPSSSSMVDDRVTADPFDLTRDLAADGLVPTQSTDSGAAAAVGDGPRPPGRAVSSGVVGADSVTVGRLVDGPASAVGGTEALRQPAMYVDIGVMVEGYEGGIGRTVWLHSEEDLSPTAASSVAADEAHQQLLDACRPGATGRDLRATAAAVGAYCWRVRGVGMGFEPPVITDRLGEAATIEAGMVLSVEVDVGGWRQRDLVLVGRNGF